MTAKASRGVPKLDLRLRHAGWTVENLAVGGLTTRAALAYERLNELPVGFVTFSFSTNDAAPWKQLPPEEFGRNYAQLFAQCSGQVIVLSPSPVIEQAAWHRTSDLQRRHSALADRLSDEAGGICVDLFDLLGDREDMLASHGVHLSDLAYERISLAVLAVLTSELSPARSD